MSYFQQYNHQGLKQGEFSFVVKSEEKYVLSVMLMME